MGLGSTAKKLQSLADTAEELYARMNDVRSDVANLKEDLAETTEQVDDIERELAAHRALLEAVAAEQGVDVAATLREAGVPDAAPADEASGEAAGESDAKADGGVGDDAPAGGDAPGDADGPADGTASADADEPAGDDASADVGSAESPGGG